MSVQLTWHGDEWMAQVGIPAAQAAITHAADVGAQIIRKSLGNTHNGVRSKPGSPPNTQSNNLRRSIFWMGSKGLTAVVGTNAAYAKILEFGGTIKPIHGKSLAIPVGEGKKLMKGKFAEGGEGAFAPRSIINALKYKYGDGRKRLVWLPRKNGGTVIGIMDRGTSKGNLGAKFTPLFLLVRQSTIQARPFMRPLIHNPANRAALAKAAQEAFASAVARLSRGKGRAAA